MPKISIIVPVYNVENYLDICLDSIIAQSFRDFEVICVNDGSTDTSPEILDRYSQFDNRIKVFNKENGGLSDARNYGMEKVSGEYTMFVDSDDWLSHLILERLYKNIVQYDSDYNFCGVKNADNDTGKTSVWQLYHPREFESVIKHPYFNESEIPPEFMYKFHVMAWGKLYKTDFIKDFRFPKGKIYEDNPFFAECYLAANRISYDHSPMYYYRTNRKDSIIKNKSDKYKDIYDIADMVKSVFERYKKYDKYKTDYILHYLKAFFFYTIRTKDDETRRLSFDLLKQRLDKFNPKEFDEEKLNKDDVYKTIYAVKDMDYAQFTDRIIQQRKIKEGK